MGSIAHDTSYNKVGESEKDFHRPWVSNYKFAAPREFLPLIDENGNGDKLIKSPPLLIPVNSNGLKFRQVSISNSEMLNDQSNDESLRVPIKIRNRLFVFTDKSSNAVKSDKIPISFNALISGAHNYIQRNDKKHDGEEIAKKGIPNDLNIAELSCKTLYLMPKCMKPKNRLTSSCDSFDIYSNSPLMSEINSLCSKEAESQDQDFTTKIVDEGFAKIMNNFPYGISGEFLDLKVKELEFSNKESEYVGNWELLQIDGLDNSSSVKEFKNGFSQKKDRTLKFNKNSLFDLEQTNFSDFKITSNSLACAEASAISADLDIDHLNQIVTEKFKEVLDKALSNVTLENNLLGTEFSKFTTKQTLRAGDVVLACKVIIKCELNIESVWQAFSKLSKTTFDSLSSIYFDQNILTEEENFQIQLICYKNNKMELIELLIWFYSIIKIRSHCVNGSEGTLGVMEKGLIAPHDNNPNAIYRSMGEYVCYVAIKDIPRGESVKISHKTLLFIDNMVEINQNKSDQLHKGITNNNSATDKSLSQICSDFDDDDAEEIIEMVHKRDMTSGLESSDEITRSEKQSNFSDDLSAKNVKDTVTISTCEQASSRLNYSESSMVSDSLEPSECSYENLGGNVDEKFQDSEPSPSEMVIIGSIPESVYEGGDAINIDETGSIKDDILKSKQLELASVFYEIYEDPDKIASNEAINYKEILDSIQNHFGASHWLFAGFHFLAARHLLYHSPCEYISFTDFKNALSHMLIFYEMIKTKAPSSVYVDFIPLMGLVMRIALASGQWLLFTRLVNRGHLEQIRRCLGFWDPTFISFRGAYDYIKLSLKSHQLSIEKLQNFASMSSQKVPLNTKFEESGPEELLFNKLCEAKIQEKQVVKEVKKQNFIGMVKKIPMKIYQSIGDNPTENPTCIEDVTKTHPESLVNKYMFPQPYPIPGGNYEAAFMTRKISENLEKQAQSRVSHQDSIESDSYYESLEDNEEVYNLPLIQLSDPLGIGSTFIDSMKVIENCSSPVDQGGIASKKRLPSLNYSSISELNNTKDGKFPPHRFFTNFFYVDHEERKKLKGEGHLKIKTSSEEVPDFNSVYQAQKEYLKAEHESQKFNCSKSKESVNKAIKCLKNTRARKEYPDPMEISKLLAKGLATIFNPKIHTLATYEELKDQNCEDSKFTSVKDIEKFTDGSVKDIDCQFNVSDDTENCQESCSSECANSIKTDATIKIEEYKSKIPPPPKFHIRKSQSFLHKEYKYAINDYNKSLIKATMKI